MEGKKEGRKEGSPGWGSWCPDERRFAGDPCGSSLREENRCSTDSSAIPLSSLAPNPTLLGPTTPSPSFSHQTRRPTVQTRTERTSADENRKFSRGSSSLRRDGVKARCWHKFRITYWLTICILIALTIGSSWSWLLWAFLQFKMFPFTSSRLDRE